MILFSILLPVIYGTGVWGIYRYGRRAAERLDREESDDIKRFRRLRHFKAISRWSPALSIVCFAGAISVLALTRDIEFTAVTALYGVMLALGWKVSQWSQRVERIEDIAERRSARAVLHRRRLAIFGWFAVVVLVFQIVMWIVQFGLGVATPSALSKYFISGNLELLFGMFAVSVGLTGRPVPSDPHCFKCGYPYDTVARPVRCPECGEGLGISGSRLKHVRWVRMPQLIAVGGALFLIGFLNFAVRTMPLVGGALSTIAPTRALIAQIGGEKYNFKFKAEFAEIQTRMPLKLADRDRLVEIVIDRSSTEDGWSSFYSSGVDVWFGKTLSRGPNGAKHVERALDLVEHADLKSDDFYRTLLLLKALYLTPVSALTPKQYDQLVRFSFKAVETKPFNATMAYTLGGSAWLTTQSLKGRLTPEQQARFDGDTDALAGK